MRTASNDTRACRRCGRTRRTKDTRSRAICRDCFNTADTPNPDNPPRWDEAACIGYDPEWWFADQPQVAHKGGGRTTANRRDIEWQVSMAKAICGTCPLQDTCAQYALDNRLVGIFGGTTTKDRGQVRPR